MNTERGDIIEGRGHNKCIFLKKTEKMHLVILIKSDQVC
jgi:hypothetical protein